VIASPGAQSALSAVILCLSDPGSVIAAEPLIYPGLRAAAAQTGRRVVTVATDSDGMRPDALEAACRAHAIRLIYLNPTLQNPTTHTMPEHRRRDIAQVAAQCGARIIEDDPYWLLTPDAPPPVAALAPAQTIHIATLSKCLSPDCAPHTWWRPMPTRRSRSWPRYARSPSWRRRSPPRSPRSGFAMGPPRHC
jgi:DNA-binding transcriptional MocR family regulator